MQTDAATFFSDGLRLSAFWLLPDAFDRGRRQPLVIACSGFTGLAQIHPARFARYLTARGHACFAFDYRGFADSEGPRGRVLLDEQVRDIVHAVAFAQTAPWVDPSRIVLLGWGMGGGLVIDAARGLTGIAGLVAINAFFVGARVQQAHRGDDGLRAFRERVDAERRERATTGRPALVDPFEIYPLDAQSRGYVDTVLRAHDGYDADRYSFELAESLLRFDVEARAPAINIPLLVAHGEKNRLHPPTEAAALVAAWRGPVEHFRLAGAGHTEFMHDDNPTFLTLAGRLETWIRKQVAS